MRGQAFVTFPSTEAAQDALVSAATSHVKNINFQNPSFFPSLRTPFFGTSIPVG